MPTITSNIPPFTEFLDRDSSLLINSDSKDNIANAMLDILDKDIAQKLIDNSATIPSQYSWQKSAQTHLNQYIKTINLSIK